MKILFFTQYFWPENFRINELVNFFRNKDNQNIVLTSYPSYPNKKKFENFKKSNDSLIISEKVYRSPVFLRNDSNVSIILNYLSFILSSFFYGIYVNLKNRFDIIFLFCPSPIFASIPIILLNKIFKKKVVLWVLDLWPDTIVDLKIIKNKYLINFIKRIVVYIYNNSDLILAQSNSIQREIQKTTKTKCIYFPSWPEEKIDEVKIKYPSELKKKNDQSLKVMFTGNVGEAQSFETLIEAAKILKKTEKVEWIIVGDGRWKEKLNLLIQENKLVEDVKLLNSVPITEIQSYFNYSDVLYLSLKNNSTFRKTIPGKLQTYMSSKKPIIASISGEANELIKKSKCGLVSEAEDYYGLVDNVKKFINLSEQERQDLANNGEKFSLINFKKQNILENLKNEIKNIL